MYRDLRSRIENDFADHSANVVRKNRINLLKRLAKNLAHEINQLCPDSREKSIALTHLEECLMWAEASLRKNRSIPKQRGEAPQEALENIEKIEDIRDIKPEEVIKVGAKIVEESQL